jgi:putative transposase
MIKSYKIRLLPNEIQEQKLWEHVNVARFTWNYGLAYQSDRYKNGEKHLSGYDLRKVFISLKKEDEHLWLKNISAHTIYNVVLDLDLAYKNFFKKISGKPKFKSKHKCKQAFPVKYDCVYFIDNRVNIEKIGKIKYQTNYTLPQGREYKFSNPRIKYENGKWILSFGIECENQTQKLNDFSMGIDLGVKELAYVSYDNKSKKYKNINKTKKMKHLKKRLKQLQRKVSRKYEANKQDKKYIKTKNIIKTEAKIKKLHTKISNIRKDYIHKITSELVNLNPKRIVIEDLNIQGMMKNKHLSKAIAEQNLYEFRRQIEYKSAWKGIEVIIADRFFPSSKTCSCCGNIKSDLKLKDRVYKCECGLEIDRDLNASINLMNYVLVN